MHFVVLDDLLRTMRNGLCRCWAGNMFHVSSLNSLAHSDGVIGVGVG